MLFNSIEFLIFFPVVVSIYFLLPGKYRWILLLLASYYFYMAWKAEYVVLIMASTLVDYFAGLRMSKLPDKKSRRKYLLLSLIVNLGMLFTFKYYNFFSQEFREMLNAFNVLSDIPQFQLLLPVGISFYTFQTLSYTIDVYNDKIKPEKHAGVFAVYVAFFPQLVAGPIERAGRLLPQFHKVNRLDASRITDGLRLMLWGFFKKVAVADNLAIYVDQVYGNPADQNGIAAVIATIFFAFQIFCDFSGYSDIAIGTAKIMGYELMDNFRAPYYSKSIPEFWRRWHISLSTWFRDYLYIRLGGNRVVKWRWYYNLFITFLISGLWHGANWTFVVWGALHGFYMIVNVSTEKWREWFLNTGRVTKWIFSSKFLNIAFTFILVCFAWIFFRANNIADAGVLISKIANISLNVNEIFVISPREFYPILIVLFIMLLIHHFERNKRNITFVLSGWSRPLRWLLYSVMLWSIFLFGNFTQQEFIYFTF